MVTWGIFPTATKVRVVSNNLNTHAAGSLDKAFSPEETRRILDRLEVQHTPSTAVSSTWSRSRSA